MAVYKKKGRWIIKGTLKRLDGSSYSYTKIAHGCVKEKEAIAYEVRFREKYQIEEKEKRPITFEEVAEMAIESSSVKESTKDTNRRCIKVIYPFIGNKRIDRIDSNSLQSAFDSLAKDMSYGGVANVKATASKVFRYAIKQKYVRSNPTAYVTLKKDTNKIRKEMAFWEPDQFEQFIQLVDDVELRTFFIFQFWMGTRRGEAKALQWKDIDMDTRTVSIYKTTSYKDDLITSPKTKNSVRNITMPNVVYEAIKELYEKQRKMYKFNDERYLFGYYKPTGRSREYSYFSRLQKRTDLPRINLHGLRHSHVSYLINNMSDKYTVYDISKRIGDNVNTVLSTYAHWFKNADKKLVDAIDNTSHDIESALPQLETLKKALDMGLITSDDYDAKKRQILGI